MKIFTPNRTRSGLGPAWALLTILLGFLLLHLTSSPVWGTTLPPCGCPNVSCAGDEYCRIDDSCEPSGTGRCYGPGELPPCGCPNVSCDEDEYCRIDFSCEPSGTGRCYTEADDGNGNGGPICTCTTADGGCGIQTAIGCIPTAPGEFAQWILGVGIKLGTLVATLLIIIGGFQVVSSTGDPEKLADAKSRITAAVAGLLFILLSVIILSIIGVEIIGISF